MADGAPEVGEASAQVCAREPAAPRVVSDDDNMPEPAAGPLVAKLLEDMAAKRSSVLTDIDELMFAQAEVRAKKKAVAVALKNAQRRKQRLKHKARLLSAEDLRSVLCLRVAEETASSAKPKKRAKTSTQPSGSPSMPSTGPAAQSTEDAANLHLDEDPELQDSQRT